VLQVDFQCTLEKVVSIDSTLNYKCAFVRRNKKYQDKTASWISLAMKQLVTHYYTVKRNFKIVLNTLTPHYIHTRIRKLLPPQVFT